MELTFKDKMMYNIFLKYCGYELQDGALVEVDSKSGILIGAAIRHILNNEELLKKVILEGYYNGPESKSILDNFINYLTDKQMKVFESKLEQIVKIELEKDISLVNIFYDRYDFNNIEVYISVLKEKLEEGKLSDEELDNLISNCLSREILENPILISTNIIIETILGLNDLGYSEKSQYITDEIINHIQEKVAVSELTEEEKNSVMKAYSTNLRRTIKGKMTAEQFGSCLRTGLFHNNYRITASYARDGNNSLACLTFDQIDTINVKAIKEILSIADKTFQLDPEEQFLNPVYLIKMYVIFGKQRTIELIQGKYGDLNYGTIALLMENVSTKGYVIPTKNAEVAYDEYQQSLITFLFASGANDKSANFRRILESDQSLLETPLDRIVSEWKLHHDLLGGNVSFDELKKQLDSTSVVLPPHQREALPTIKLAGLEHTDKILELHEKMQKRIVSTIPKVKGTLGRYEYEILDLKDIHQLDVGYLTHCCFTLEGASETSLIDSCTSNNSRIFVVKKDGKLVAQSWVWRNGNTVCFDNAEAYGVSVSGLDDMWEVYEKAGKELITISASKEDKKIELITIGEGYGKIPLKGERLKGLSMPKPIGEDLYTDASNQRIITTSEEYTKPKMYAPEPKFTDERKVIKIVDPQQSKKEEVEEVDKNIDIINSWIDPNNEKKSNALEEITYYVGGQDWYIAITASGEIIKKKTGFDKRAEVEMKVALEEIQNKIKTGELNYNIVDIEILRQALESAPEITMEEGIKHGK